MFKLRDWISESRLDWCNLSTNPNAIQLLEANPEKINCWALQENPSRHLLKSYKKIKDVEDDWRYQSLNPDAIPLLEKNLDKVCWNTLCLNPAAIPLLTKNQDKIHWYRHS